MKSSKFQSPTSRDHPMTKFQTRGGRRDSFGRLKFRASLALGCWCLVLLHCSIARAQTYSIDWSTIDGGGGTSTGGVYAVTGTIGQPDAGKMSGGNYAIDGGFWGIIAAVQTPGAPLLTITRTTTNTVAVSWRRLQPDLRFSKTPTPVGTVNWSNVTTTPGDDGTTKTLIVNPPAGNRFYRLFKL